MLPADRPLSRPFSLGSIGLPIIRDLRYLSRLDLSGDSEIRTEERGFLLPLAVDCVVVCRRCCVRCVSHSTVVLRGNFSLVLHHALPAVSSIMGWLVVTCCVALLLTCCSWTASVCAALSLPQVLSSSMVLQRAPQMAHVWGGAERGAVVELVLDAEPRLPHLCR